MGFRNRAISMMVHCQLARKKGFENTAAVHVGCGKKEHFLHKNLIKNPKY